MNKVFLLGNIGNFKLQATNSGNSVLNFSVATSKKLGDKTETTWHNCAAFNKMADNLNRFFKKGSKVFVEGEVSKKVGTGKDGVEREYVSVIALNVQLCGDKPSQSGNSQTNTVDHKTNQGRAKW